jgi:hypothetical protein
VNVAIATRRSPGGRRRIAAALTLLALSLIRPTAGLEAQTVPPPPADAVIQPPAGTLVVPVELPALAPEGIPALQSDGTIAVVPPNPDGGVALVNAGLGAAQATLIVPADPGIPLIVRVQSLTAGTPMLPLPEGMSSAAVVFSIEVYDGTSGASIREFPKGIPVGVRPPGDLNPAALVAFRFDAVGLSFEVLPVTVDPTTGVVQVTVTNAGIVVLGVAG